MKTTIFALRRRPVALYFVLTYVLAWAVWIPLALARRGPGGEGTPLSLTLLAGAAPGVAATLATGALYGRQGISYLWRRLLRWRIAPGWYLAAWAVPAALPILAAMLAGIGSGQGHPWLAAISPLGLLAGLLMYIPMTIFEEIGWRGLAQPGLQARPECVNGFWTPDRRN